MYWSGGPTESIQVTMEVEGLQSAEGTWPLAVEMGVEAGQGWNDMVTNFDRFGRELKLKLMKLMAYLDGG